MGCTRMQILWKVKLPLAILEIMPGLNQTITFGLAMLVIAALVGIKGLGQAVYIALGAADIINGLGGRVRHGDYRHDCRPHNSGLGCT